MSLALYKELGMHAGDAGSGEIPGPALSIVVPVKPRAKHHPQSNACRQRIRAAHMSNNLNWAGKPRVPGRALPGTVKQQLVDLSNGIIQRIDARDKSTRNKYYSIAARLGLRISCRNGIITIVSEIKST